MNKEQILAAVNAMPEDITMDALFERLHVISESDSGRKQSEEGQLVSQDEVKELAKKWSNESTLTLPYGKAVTHLCTSFQRLHDIISQGMLIPYVL